MFRYVFNAQQFFEMVVNKTDCLPYNGGQFYFICTVFFFLARDQNQNFRKDGWQQNPHIFLRKAVGVFVQFIKERCRFFIGNLMQAFIGFCTFRKKLRRKKNKKTFIFLLWRDLQYMVFRRRNKENRIILKIVGGVLNDKGAFSFCNKERFIFFMLVA